MNTTTRTEREAITARARELIVLDDDKRVTNAREVETALRTEFGISHQRASTAIAKAARQSRHPGWGGARENAGGDRREQARANGKQVGRPPKPPRIDAQGNLKFNCKHLSREQKAQMMIALQPFWMPRLNTDKPDRS